MLQLQLLIVAKRSLARLDRLAGAILGMERALEHVEDVAGRRPITLEERLKQLGLEGPTTRGKSVNSRLD